TNLSLGSASFSSLAILAREASINLKGATIEGGSIDVSTTAGDRDLLGELSKLAGGNAAWASGIIQNLLPFISDSLSLPLSVLFKKADATVELGQGTAQTFTPSQMDPSTGEITFSSPHNLSTGDAVTYSVSGSDRAIGGLTSSATYYAIVDGTATLRL